MESHLVKRTSICGHEAAVRVFPASTENAPTIIALHGFTGSGLDFVPLRKAMGADSWCWICPDFPGHGISSSPSELDPYSLDNTLRLIEFARECAPHDNRVNLLGYSMGGRVALHYLRHAKPLPAVVIGTSPGIDDPIERDARRIRDGHLVEKLGNEGIESFSDYWEAQPLIQPQCKLDEHLRTELSRRRRQNNATGLSNSLLSIGNGILPSLWNDLKSFARLACLFGEDDLKFAGIAREMSRINNSIKVLAIPSSGHSPHLEAPRLVAGVLESFFSH